MNITVYLGARDPDNPALTFAARELGTWIGANNHQLIYGGSHCGLMGELAESTLLAGGRVTGVEPQFFIDAGFEYDEVTELIVTKDMSDRKAKMIELGDAFIAFPGGTGTLEEISEVISKICLRHLQAPCIVYNLDGYYEGLKILLKHMVEMGLASEDLLLKVMFAENLEEIKRVLEETKEYLDIVDESGQPTGHIISRDAAHMDGILHRTAHVWVVRKTGRGYEILLQKRSEEKESFPGLYDTSSAGHIPAGDEPLESALRELKEELGIAAASDKLHYAGSFRIQYEKEFHGRMFRDKEVTWVYVYEKPVDISALQLQESEVSEVRWFDLDEVWDEIKTDRSRFCVPTGGLNVLREYLKGREA